MKSSRTRFLLAVFVLISVNFTLCQIPENWQDYIASDVLKKYNGKSTIGFSTDNFQGDISGVEKNLESENLNRDHNVISDERKRWEGGVVPYVISDIYQNDERNVEKTLIQIALNSITSFTSNCIQFVKRTTEEDYIYISRGLSCSSDVGRTGRKQVISLTTGCLDEIGAIQHELLHALGFYHEQSRTDRNQYIWINWANLQESARNDFKIATDAVTFGLPYDYESVMHYRWNAFAINTSSPTIIPKQRNKRIGQSTNLSVLDIIKLKRAYNCPDTTSSYLTPVVAKTSLSNQPLPIESTTTASEPEVETSTTNQIAKMTTRSPAIVQSVSPLPNYELKILDEKACAGLDTDNCHLLSSASCATAYYDFECTQKADNFEIKFHLTKVKRSLQKSAIVFGLEGDAGLVWENFRPVSHNVIRLHLHSVNNLRCDKLNKIRLPNLLQLDILNSININISRNSFSNFIKLRILAFYNTSILSMEQGSLENLGNLKMLALDWGITAPFSDDIREHLFRFHCDDEYSWLRDYLHQHPGLLNPRKDGEVYSITGIANWPFSRRSIYYAVDCNRPDLTGYQNQVEFSILTAS